MQLNYNQEEIAELLKNLDNLENNLPDAEKRKLIQMLIEDIYKLEEQIKTLTIQNSPNE